MGNLVKATPGMALVLATMLGGCISEDADPFNTKPSPTTTGAKEEPSIGSNDKTKRPECRASESLTLGPSNEWNPRVSVASEWKEPTIDLLATARFHLVGVIARSGELFGFYHDNDNPDEYIGRIVESDEMIHLEARDFTVAPDLTQSLDVFDDVTLCVVPLI